VKLGARRIKAAQLPYFERDHAWFASFAPMEDPEIVVVVLNEHSGFGSSNAAPTASALIKKYFELKQQDAGIATSTTTVVEPGKAITTPPPVATVAATTAPPDAAPGASSGAAGATATLPAAAPVVAPELNLVPPAAATPPGAKHAP
jgi:penicillin-binding protein 2